jgi:hypothetical protein
VVVTQHPPGSADRVFLDACRVSLSQQYHRVQHSLHPLKRNEKENKIKCIKPLPKHLDDFTPQTKFEKTSPKQYPTP